MSEHTKEPWNPGFFDGDGFNICSSSNGRVIGVIKTEEDRRRIVACVNACQGVAIEALEGDRIEWLQVGKYNETAQQRDELLAALKEAKDVIDSYTELDDGFIVIQQINAALAKAETAK